MISFPIKIVFQKDTEQIFVPLEILKSISLGFAHPREVLSEKEFLILSKLHFINEDGTTGSLKLRSKVLPQ